MSVERIQTHLRRAEDALSAVLVQPSRGVQPNPDNDNSNRLYEVCLALARAVEECANEIERLGQAADAQSK
jgi:hypothetical protein